MSRIADSDRRGPVGRRKGDVPGGGCRPDRSDVVIGFALLDEILKGSPDTVVSDAAQGQPGMDCSRGAFDAVLAEFLPAANFLDTALAEADQVPVNPAPLCCVIRMIAAGAVGVGNTIVKSPAVLVLSPPKSMAATALSP